jgi:hypothetical protein
MTELERPPILENSDNNENIFVGYLSDEESTNKESDSEDVDTKRERQWHILVMVVALLIPNQHWQYQLLNKLPSLCQ